MRFHERAIPGWIARAVRKGSIRVVTPGAEDVSAADPEPRVIRSVLGENLHVKFGTEIKQTFEAYPPDPEAAALTALLPNQNPPRGAAASGDRANENNCMTAATTYASCPSGITPGAVVFYLPNGGCLNNSATGDTYVFSGYQYNWMSVYEPGNGSPPANTCANTLGAAGNSAYIGLVYAPAASISLTSPFVFESPSTGGLIASTVSFSGTMPTIVFNAAYAPVPPASRLTG